MAESSGSGMKTIGQVVDVLSREFPDVSVSSLRFLEREGLLSPQRKAGGHRLYSARDIERARVIKQWQANRFSLKEIRSRLDNAPQYREIPAVVEKMTTLLLTENIEGACATLEEAFDSGVPLLTLCDDVLTPVMRNLGDDEGNHLIPVDVQFELDQRLFRFLSQAAIAPENQTGRPVVLAACPPWERHDMPLQMLSALMIERGASMHFIGSQVDSEFMRDANTRLKPDLILISLTIKPDNQRARKWIKDLIDSMAPGQKLLLGGMGARWLEDLQAPNVQIVGMETYGKQVDRILEAASGSGESSGQSA